MADGSAVVDQTWSTTANPIDPYSYTRSKMFGEVIFDLLKNTVLKMGYSFASIDLPSELQKIKVRPEVEEDLEVSCHE